MLKALDGDQYVKAKIAVRGNDFRCRNCRSPVILRRGPIRVPHFSHKPGRKCDWVKGETQEHLKAKEVFVEAFQSRGIRAEEEYIVKELDGDRRADVMVWGPKGQMIALELQHSKIDPKEAAARTASYARAKIAVLWIPFLSKKAWENGSKRGGGAEGDFHVKRYSIRPWERWLIGFTGGLIWFYDPRKEKLWYGGFSDHFLYQDYSEWYDGGNLESAGGYSYLSDRWKELTLWGPFDPKSVMISKRRLRSQKNEGYVHPDRDFGIFVQDFPDKGGSLPQ